MNLSKRKTGKPLRHCNPPAAERQRDWGKKNGARIEIQPRFKIQYPMKNQYNNNCYFPLVQYPFWGIYPRLGSL